MRVQPEPHALKAKQHLSGWRWLLVQILTDGEIEAIPVLPARPIMSDEVIVVRLGEPGAYNTAEVKDYER